MGKKSLSNSCSFSYEKLHLDAPRPPHHCYCRLVRYTYNRHSSLETVCRWLHFLFVWPHFHTNIFEGQERWKSTHHEIVFHRRRRRLLCLLDLIRGSHVPDSPSPLIRSGGQIVLPDGALMSNILFGGSQRVLCRPELNPQGTNNRSQY